jgi:hypothetical protein
MVPLRGLIAAAEFQGFIASHSTMAIATTMMAAHSTGVACFELPLRGESLAA